jgi:hypothetical protein
MVRLESEDFIDGVKQKIAEDCEDENARIVLVWLSKTIQNWKGLFYCFGNERYYEATFNGDKDKLYLDCYKIDHKKVFKVTEGEM